MKETKIENNRVTVIGEIVSGFTFSHEVFGENFYTVDILVNRLSDETDTIPLVVSERLIDIDSDCLGKTIEATGQFRSFNKQDGERNRLVLYVFAREINHLDSFTDFTKANRILLEGFICKKPVYRITPSGREIADILIAVNRPYGKTDYIPCIAWGRNARFASEFNVGEKIRIMGRVQSREYKKRLNEVEFENRVAYEVSVSKLEVAYDTCE